MFDLFNGKNGVIDDNDDDNDNEWLNVCLGPLTSSADVLGGSHLRLFGRNPLWG